jgi:uncharacterized protein (DUF924 family)
MTPQDLLDFWFAPDHEKLWFRATPDFDRQIRQRFESAWLAAQAGQLNDWEGTPQGALALVILLDQLPLNMFRGQPQGFATESMARIVARHAIERQFDERLPDKGKAFLYMPFMHSEDLVDQERSVALFRTAGLSENLKFAFHHRDIIRRFGRFPHRNAILGRSSSAEEKAWLESKEAFRG